MFNNFQTGVKIMSGSDNCFTGELLLVIKDIVDTGAEAAVEGISNMCLSGSFKQTFALNISTNILLDFEGHIEKLAQESGLITNDEGKKESTFFAYQMYKSGLSIIPYPPLANEKFFVKLNTEIQPAIDEINAVHIGGKQFLNHVKLIMAKLNIGDWTPMSDQHAKVSFFTLFYFQTYRINTNIVKIMITVNRFVLKRLEIIYKMQLKLEQLSNQKIQNMVSLARLMMIKIYY